MVALSQFISARPSCLCCILILLVLDGYLLGQGSQCYQTAEEHGAIKTDEFGYLWFWRDGKGCVRSEEELLEILSNPDQRPDLSFSVLDRGIFADLRFTEAALRMTGFTGAVLSGARLDGADLRGAILASAILRGAVLAEAKLGAADLSGTNLEGTNLRGAELRNTSLEGSFMARADLSGAIYEPRSHPRIDSLAQATGLDRLRADRDRSKLVELKNRFREAGHSNAAAEVTAALWRLDDPSWLERLLLEGTCNYGADWTRPLIFLIFNWLIFSWFYFLAMVEVPEDDSTGIYIVCRRNRKSGEQIQAMRLILPIGKPVWRKLQMAVFFGIIEGAFLGFQAFNPGHWFRRLLIRRIDLEARGWPRFAAGVQSLLSFVLLALSVLSYLGTPFDRW